MSSGVIATSYMPGVRNSSLRLSVRDTHIRHLLVGPHHRWDAYKQLLQPLIPALFYASLLVLTFAVGNVSYPLRAR
jgi:hypothetical protein